MAKKTRVGKAGIDDYGRLWGLLPEGLRGVAMDALAPTPHPVEELPPGMVGPPRMAEEGLLGAAQRGGGNLLKKGLREAPVGTALGLAQLAMMFKDPIGQMTDEVGLNPWRAQDRADRMQAALRGDSLQAESDRKRQELEQLTQENMARLVQFEPELAQTVLAGRRLPRGARVIGGQKRFDLLQQVAQQMAGGQFQGQAGVQMGGGGAF